MKVKKEKNNIQPVMESHKGLTNPKEDLKGITTHSGTAYQGPPTVPTISSSLPKVVERETKVTKDTVPPINNGSTKDIQPSVVQIETLVPNSEPVIAPVIEPVVAPISDSKPNQKPSIPYPSRFQDQKLHALILMQKFGPSIKSLLTNKDKLFELARTPLNEHCLAVLLKNLPEKLGDPKKFLISCDFARIDECLPLVDLDASINLMPLSVWSKLSLPELTPTLMTLELTDRSISRPIGVAEDVFVKVGKFYFLDDFVVVDFDSDPRVPLVLRRSFLKTRRALIDVFKGELTLRVGKEAITFNLDQTSRYSSNYNDMMVNRIDVIDVACEEYSQEVLGFSDVIASGNLTFYYDPIVSTSSSTLTPFGDSDFLLEEVDAFLTLEDDATSPEVDQSYYDPEGNILLLESFLNDDSSLPPPNQGMYLPQVQKELKICKAKNDKSSIVVPLEVELKDLPPHLEYSFLEGDDKLPFIIAKDLSVEEKAALIKEKSHFMFKESIILDHKISKNGIEVDKAKVDVIAKLPHPTTVKGSFLSSRGDKYILVAVDYLLKWVEAKALPINDARVVCKFLKSLFARFGTPRAIISNHGTYFCNDQFAKVMLKILERTEGENHVSWSDKLDDALWAFRKAFKTPIGCTPYKLVYGKACHLPIKLEHKAYWDLKHANFDLQTVGDHHKVQLNELNELRDQAYENSLIYKEKMKRIHDSKIKDCVLNVGDRVLLFNSILKIFSGKLKTRWSRPFTITHVFPYGTVESS
nr:reverse transcriptase domain-containing protein [Tanacetum cinerariifolium]